jgi:hypothetical protein
LAKRVNWAEAVLFFANVLILVVLLRGRPR